MKIKTLSLTDFRAFPGPAPTTFELDGKNLLVYGENGSGKSSLFHALQGFFNPVSSGDIAKHKNVFTGPAGGVCEVRVDFDDGTTSRWTGTTVVTVPMQKASDVQGARLRAAVLDYRSILDTNYANTLVGERMKTAEGTYRYTDPTAGVNLFSVAVNTLLAGFRVANPGGSGVSQTTIGNLWTGVQSRVSLLPSSNNGILAPLENARVAFNAGMNAALQAINPLLQRLLNDLGHADLELMPLTFGGLTPNFDRLLAKRYFAGQALPLHVRFRTHPTAAPHSFLNEARLSALGLVIYLASRLAMVPQTTPDALKLLVLDDVLIGLDQSNRIPVLDVLEKHFRDWQIVLLTHDRLWFETARLRGEIWGGWNSMELNASADPVGYYKPRVGKVNSDAAGQQLRLARAHQKAGDRMAACVYARSAFELVLKQMCNAKGALVEYKIEARKLDTDDFLAALSRWAESNYTKADFDGVFKMLSMYRGTVLNPGSHSAPTTLTDGEVEAAISALEVFGKIPNYGKDAASVAGHLISLTAPKPADLMIGCAYLRTATWRRMKAFAESAGTLWPVGVPMDAPGLWAAVKPAMQAETPQAAQQLELHRRVLLDTLSLRDMQALTKEELLSALGVIATAAIGSPTAAKKTWSYAW